MVTSGNSARELVFPSATTIFQKSLDYNLLLPQFNLSATKPGTTDTVYVCYIQLNLHPKALIYEVCGLCLPIEE